MISSPWDRIPEAIPARQSHRKRPKPEVLQSIPRASRPLATKLKPTSPPAAHLRQRRSSAFRYGRSPSPVQLERRTQSYRRRRGTDVWHFMPQCPDWPTLDFRESSSPAAGNVCAECLDRQPMKVPSRRKGDTKKPRN